MKPSLFTPGALLQLKAGRPAAEAIHETVVRLFTDGSVGAISKTLGSFVDCFSFALALTVARAQRRQQKLDRETLAAGAYELLAQLEEEHGLSPGPEDTIQDRRDALLARMLAAQGSRRPSLEQALADLMGDDYIGIHLADPSTEVSNWPTSLGDDPQLLLADDVSRTLVRITQSISVGLGSSQAVTYTPVDPTSDDEHTLTVGDRLIVQPENLGLAEPVTVTAVGTSGGSLTFSATFNNAHDNPSLAAQMPFPAWGSSQRHIWVVLSAAAAVDAESRRQVHELMARMVTGVTTWSICPYTGDGITDQAGPWTLDGALLGRLDMNPMGTISVP